jgi:hypothetical protein
MHAILHSALTQAVRWDLIVSNPADRIEPPKPREVQVRLTPGLLLSCVERAR